MAVRVQRLPQHLDGVHPMTQTLELEFTQRAKRPPSPPTRRQLHDLRSQNLPGLAHCAQPSSLNDGLTEVVIILTTHLTAADTRPATQPRSQSVWLSRSMYCCIATAHDNARDAAPNTTISPSPSDFTSTPPFSATA